MQETIIDFILTIILIQGGIYLIYIRKDVLLLGISFIITGIHSIMGFFVPEYYNPFQNFLFSSSLILGVITIAYFNLKIFYSDHKIFKLIKIITTLTIGLSISYIIIISHLYSPLYIGDNIGIIIIMAIYFFPIAFISIIKYFKYIYNQRTSFDSQKELIIINCGLLILTFASILKPFADRIISQFVLFISIILIIYGYHLIKNRDDVFIKLKSLNIQLEEISQQLESKISLEKVLKETISKLKESNKAKSIFFANISHEIRTPLNIIIGFSEILRNNPDPEIIDQINPIYDAGKNLLKMIERIMKITSIESGLSPPKISNFNIESVLEIVLNNYREKAKEKSIIIESSIEGGRSLYSDEERIKEILTNLIENAIKFTETGKISVLLNNEKNYFEIIVIDTGIGISKGDMDKLFQPLLQLEEHFSKTKEGLGIGLYLTKKIVDLLKGDIKVRSSLNKGTKFIIKIPIFLN